MVRIRDVGPRLGLDSRINTALKVGFTLVFALWLGWGYALAGAFSAIERNSSAEQAAYVRGEQTLSRVRTNVLLSSIYLRDALIDAGTPRREESRAELAKLRADIEGILASYVPDVSSPQERAHWARLEAELVDYWASREIALTETGAGGPQDAARLLRREVVPSRETVLEILDQIEEMQDVTNRRRQAAARGYYDSVGRRLAWAGGATMLLALLIAVIASVHVSRLERRLEGQRSSERQTKEELERLSASLVDVQEKERQSLARELHDEVGQALTALKIDIGLALRTDVPPKARAALSEAKEIAEGALRSVRDLSQLLHPSTLDDFGLPATIAAYLRSFTDRTGIRAHLTETLDQRLAPEVEVHIYRIIQEALNNVARHSGATACTVSLSDSDRIVQLVIEDNGRGLGATHEPRVRRGLGMIGMRERAQAFNGSFVAENGHGGGVRVVVELPLILAAPAVASPHKEAV